MYLATYLQVFKCLAVMQCAPFPTKVIRLTQYSSPHLHTSAAATRRNGSAPSPHISPTFQNSYEPLQMSLENFFKQWRRLLLGLVLQTFPVGPEVLSHRMSKGASTHQRHYFGASSSRKHIIPQHNLFSTSSRIIRALYFRQILF